MFRKSIDNQIFGVTREENFVEFQGIFFDVLTFDNQVNLDNATLQGIEFSYDQAFTFLPGPFDGLGVTANLALIDSDVEYPGRPGEDLPLVRQPDQVWNIIPYYQKYGIELRVAITHRSDFLVIPRDEGSSFVRRGLETGFAIEDFDRYEDERTAVDITAAYTFPSRKWKILAQARNINNAPETEYQGNPNRYDRFQEFGASYFLGFSINL